MLTKIIKYLLFSGELSLPPTTGPNHQPRTRAALARNRSRNRSGAQAFWDEVAGTQLALVPGCIVACDLLGSLDHSGIYIGRRRIIEKNGDGELKRVSLHDFMSSSPLRTGISLFVACRNGKPIRSPEISRRAKEMEGRGGKYKFLSNNCHKFTAYCATGKTIEKNGIWSFGYFVDELEKEFGPIEWRSVNYRGA